MYVFMYVCMYVELLCRCIKSKPVRLNLRIVIDGSFSSSEHKASYVHNSQTVKKSISFNAFI